MQDHPVHGTAYCRKRGGVLQWLEQREDGTLVGWEVREDGTVTPAVEVPGTLIPAGYVAAGAVASTATDASG